MPVGRKKRGGSLRLRLFIIMVLIAVVPTVVVSLLLMYSNLDKQVDAVISDVQGQVLILSNQLVSSDYVNNSNDQTLNAVIEQIGDIMGGRIQIMNSAGRILKDTYDVDRGRYNISEYVLTALSRQSVKYYNKEEKIVVIAQPLYSNAEQVVLEEATDDKEAVTGPALIGAILVTSDLELKINTLSFGSRQMYLLWASVAVVAICLSFMLLRHFFKPFSNLVSAIEQASDGRISKVAVRDYVETAKISDSVNTTLTRLDVLDKSRQQFVSNVSHELKTPITSMRVLADSLNSMGEVPIEMYQEFMTDISSELDRESKIIDNLLSIGRLSEDSQIIEISKISLNEWMEALLRRLSPIARENGIEITLESFRPITAEIDETKLSLAVTNLVENAIKYNTENGYVKVSINADVSHFFIKVEDSGIGIPDEAMQHLFERFYRVDKDRSRESGGTGLGLSITKQIVSLHHGHIRAYSKLGDGTTFVIRIPLVYRENDIPKEADDEEIN